MRFLKIISGLLICHSFFVNAQKEIDSIQLNKLQEDKLYKIEQWEKQIENAREKEDVYTEMVALIQKIRFQMNDYGDEVTTYKDLRYLEGLVEKNPKNRAVKNILAPMNMFLGWILGDHDNYEEALPYLAKAIKFAKQNNQAEYYKDASCHYAGVLFKSGREEQALKNYKHLEEEAIAIKDSLLRNRVYESLAWLYSERELLDSSIVYSQKSIDDFSPANQRAYRNLTLAELYISKNEKVDSVFLYAKRGLKIASERHLESQIVYAHSLLHRAYSKVEDYKNAYYHLKEFYELEQKQRSFDKGLEIGKINLDQEKEFSKLQKEIAEQRLSNQRLVIWIVSGGLLLLVLGLVYIFRQLRFIRKQNKTIEKEKLRAEQNERYKEQFLANMSHEIRTPMHAISGMLNALRRQPHPKSQDNYLDAMKLSADNLLVLLNDALDMSKIESGNLDIERVAMNPKTIIEHTVNIFKHKAEEKGLSIIVHIDPDFPKQIIGDPGRLNQILLNLISNAIKFTEVGSITIELLNKKNNFVLKISDTGTGLTENEIETIFESFKQGSNVVKSKQGGTGLGLAICKRLIELQGGSIWAESELNKGSTFYVELPLVSSSTIEDAKIIYSENELKEIGKTLKGTNILIAEDNAFNIMVVKDDLNWFIPEVNLTIVGNGKEAFEAILSTHFEIVLMDVQMPEMNGYEATEKIRLWESESKTTRTPIIAMTASLLKDQIDRCYEAGMDAYIPKPYKPEELIITINNALGNN